VLEEQIGEGAVWCASMRETT